MHLVDVVRFEPMSNQTNDLKVIPVTTWTSDKCMMMITIKMMMMIIKPNFTQSTIMVLLDSTIYNH